MAKDNVEDGKQDEKLGKVPPQKIQQEAVKNVSAQGNVTIGNIDQSIGDTFQTISQYVQKSGIEFFKRTDLKEFQSPYFPQLTRLDEIVEDIHITIF